MVSARNEWGNMVREREEMLSEVWRGEKGAGKGSPRKNKRLVNDPWLKQGLARSRSDPGFGAG